MRVILADGWHIRPTQDGLELMAPEHNIALELSNPASRDELVAILVGEIEIPASTKAIEETLHQLENAGAISRQKEVVHQDLLPSKREDAAWRIRKTLVGSRGPVTSVYWLNPGQSKLSLSKTHLFTAKYLERTGYGNETKEEWAAGSDANWEQAEFKAIMEALERHASGVIPQEQLIKSSARKLKEQALDPRKMVAYTRTQYRNGLPFTPFSRGREYRWKSITMLPEGVEKFLPVECLYYPVGYELAPHLYTAASSSGVAAGLSFEDALLRGVNEAIERDAFMIAWLNRISMPLIHLGSVPDDCRERVHALESLGYRVSFIDITREFCPVVLAVAINVEARPCLVLGAGANTDGAKALEKALSEVEHQLYWEWREPENVRSISDPREVNGVLDHMALYASPEHLSKAAFLWSGEVKLMRESAPDAADVWIIIERLGQHNIEVAALDLTPEYLKNAGVWVVRAIPFGLVPISFGYGTEPLRTSRYRQTAKGGVPWPGGVPFTHPFA